MTNIILIVTDQLRADITYHEKYPFVQTPNIDRLRSEGINIPNTFSQYPICGPSRASITTGRYPQQHGVLNNRCVLPDEERTMGHHFRDCGYDVVAVGKTHGHNPGFRRIPEPQPLRDTLGDDNGGFFQGQSMVANNMKDADGPQPLMGVFDHPKETHYDHVINGQIRQFLSDRDPEKPFLLWVGYHTPHPPLYPPQHLADLYPPDEIELPHVPEDEHKSKPTMQYRSGQFWRQVPAQTRKEMIAAYLALITHVDECTGDLLGMLEESSLLDDTVIVFTSDHGEQLGEHDMIGKLNSLYEGSLRVPMMVRLPSKDHAGLELNHLTELIDIFPTICDLAQVGKPAALSGKSIAPLFDNPEDKHRDHISAMVVDGRASSVAAVEGRDHIPRGHLIRTERWKLVIYTGDQGELYDLENDPHELNNLFDDSDHSGIKLELCQRMAEHMLTYTRNPTGYGYNLFPA